MDKYSWPRQPPHLYKLYWDLWDDAIKKCFTQAPYFPNKLKQNLGSWTHDPRLHWTWFVLTEKAVVYCKEGNLWRKYMNSRNTSLPGALFKRTHYTTTTLPTGSCPADIKQRGNNTTAILGSYSSHDTPFSIPQPSPTTLQQALPRGALQTL